MIFRALRPCDTFDEKYHGSKHYMKDDYSTSCDSSQHDFIVGWGIFTLFFFALGVPVFSFLALYSYRNILDPPSDCAEFVSGSLDVSECGDSGFKYREMSVRRKTDTRRRIVREMSSSRLGLLPYFAFFFVNYEPRYW